MSEHEPMSCGRALLPPELWGLILSYLSKKDQRSCLSVSTSLYVLARRLIFSHITIHFGMWTIRQYHVESEFRLTKRRKLVNAITLQRIARYPRFARLIKKFSVRAQTFDSGFQWSASESASAIKRIIVALKSIPHLQSFQWYGSYPPIPTSVLQALAETSYASTLKEISICGILSFDGNASQYLAQFKSLQTLLVAGNSNLDDYAQPTARLMLKDYVPHVHPTLRYLTLPGDSLWHAPQHVFSGLHELSLHNPASLEDFSVILQHCSQLQTLNLRIDNWDCSDELLAALEAAPDSLPHLTSFKLLCDNDVFDFVPLTLTTFFKNKPMMRRLDLRFELLFEDVDELAYFLDIIAGLPRLEVIGLRLECADFTHEHLQLLDARLPLHLSALLLAWAFDPDYGSNTVAERDWIAMVRPKAPSPDLSLTVPPLAPYQLKRRQSLGYFHVLDNAGTLDLRDALLRDRPRSLELVGYGGCLCSIERDPATGASFYGTPWTEEALGFGTAEDFGCDDWEWLVRYHKWDGLVRFWA
ncbi:uncharacterized protein TRAVEDRAFT_73323 [Trametes versicolor FP-101664 SS1]|uniref:uncharacterized protein n=1 Tax=Trametes versicolor (strain FP-101664) TaxID=717944 RepID=UPI000462223F|nr:uncharacterized protein TRAVEDRAFT_73323 [Trametes versicolor FP-101664 SS1]EIW57071.1 hypothetical protein TRAVEDRAFT_73323 [Trametes versicolor FP-101664 SS1]